MEEGALFSMRSWTALFRKSREFLQRNQWQIVGLLGLIAGISIGMILKAYVQLTETEKSYIDYPGELLLRMLRVVRVPLIVTSITAGMADLCMESSRKIAACATVYIILTTFLAVATGMILVLHLKPGFDSDMINVDEEQDSSHFKYALMDLVRNMIPRRPIKAFFEHYRTEVVVDVVEVDDPISGLPVNVTVVRKSGRFIPGTNMIGLIVWSSICGVCLGLVGERNRTLLKYLKDLNKALQIMANWIMWYLPIGLPFMIAGHVIEVLDLDFIIKLGHLTWVLLLGLIIQGMVILPLIYVVLVKQNPFTIMKEVSHVLLTAMYKASSCATLPATFQCCEEKLKIDQRITRFMLPLAATFNMNGTALYEVVTTVFVAQVNGIHLDISQKVTISMTAAAASMGAEGVPATGALTSLFILTAVGLPANEASLLVALEWILDHFCTVVNVWGDCVGMAIVHHLTFKKTVQSRTTADQDSRLDPETPPVGDLCST